MRNSIDLIQHNDIIVLEDWTLSEGTGGALLDPVLLRFENQRLLQKIVFFGELFPSHWPANTAGQRFLEFFQTDKNTGSQKGIVLINLEELP